MGIYGNNQICQNSGDIAIIVFFFLLELYHLSIWEKTTLWHLSWLFNEIKPIFTGYIANIDWIMCLSTFFNIMFFPIFRRLPLTIDGI